MADNELKRTRPRCRCNIQWLLLVLMLVALAAWVYKGDEVQRYGANAMAKSHGAVGWLTGLGDKARHAYQCAKTDASTASGRTAPVTQSVMPPGAEPIVSAQTAPCCPTCQPCGSVPPYIDFSELMYGHNLNTGNAAPSNAAPSTPPSAPVAVNAAPVPAPAPVATKGAPAPVAIANAPTANMAVPPNAVAGNAVVPPNYPDYSGIAAVPPNYPPYPGMPRYDARAPAPTPAPSPIVAPKPFVNAAPVLSKDLLRARNWVAQKKLAYAAIAYRKHIAAHPDDANGYGELGNVYLLSQHYPEAAQSYYEAATRLLGAGYVDVVMPLMPVIMQYQPALGSRLKAKMTFMRK